MQCEIFAHSIILLVKLNLSVCVCVIERVYVYGKTLIQEAIEKGTKMYLLVAFELKGLGLKNFILLSLLG